MIVAGRTVVDTCLLARLDGSSLRHLQHSTGYSITGKLTMTDNEQHRQPGTSEEEPLLGRRGDASQQEGLPLYQNLVIGK